MASESLGIDSEAYLFSILKDYKEEFPNLISRRQYNDRRKFARNLCETIKRRMTNSIDGGEDYIYIASKPIEVCRIARRNAVLWEKRTIGYCASQKTHYYGYKLHVLCGLSRVFHSYDLTKEAFMTSIIFKTLSWYIMIAAFSVIENILERKYN